MHRECRIHQYYNAGEQLSGLTSYYPGGTGGCHDGGHDTLITRSMELWGPVSLTYNAVGGKGTPMLSTHTQLGPPCFLPALMFTAPFPVSSLPRRH